MLQRLKWFSYGFIAITAFAMSLEAFAYEDHTAACPPGEIKVWQWGQPRTSGCGFPAWKQPLPEGPNHVQTLVGQCMQDTASASDIYCGVDQSSTSGNTIVFEATTNRGGQGPCSGPLDGLHESTIGSAERICIPIQCNDPPGHVYGFDTNALTGSGEYCVDGCAAVTEFRFKPGATYNEQNLIVSTGETCTDQQPPDGISQSAGDNDAFMNTDDPDEVGDGVSGDDQLDDPVDLNVVDLTNCAQTDGGRVFCLSDYTDTGPNGVPDNGTAGTPATPDNTINVERSPAGSVTTGGDSNVTTYNIYNESTVDNSTNYGDDGDGGDCEPGDPGYPDCDGDGGDGDCDPEVEECDDEEAGDLCIGIDCKFPDYEGLGGKREISVVLDEFKANYIECGTSCGVGVAMNAANTLGAAAGGGGGSCPQLSFNTYLFNVSTDIHCDLWNNISPIIAGVFTAIWALLAVRIVLSA